ncbi:MAG: fibronectin type III domain-containing protein [candidate division KSB1 bacterium]|nr:fibronectin type III domain-containing protein [candidate division KSB1 bacterium]
MRSPNDTSRVSHENRSAFGFGLAVCTMLLLVLCSSALYAQAPPAPTGLTATTVSNTQIDLSWQYNPADADSFRIRRSLSATGPFALIAIVPVTVTNYSDNGLSANTQYFYVVRARKAGVSSPPSDTVSATTFPNPPSAPSGLTATTVSNSQIDLSWTDNASNEDGFKIEQATSSGGPYTQIATVGANVTTYSDTGLAGKTQYYYQVRAYNTGGNSDYSNEANAITQPDPPSTPTGLTATAASSSQINLAWTDASGTNNPTAWFRIERKTGAGGMYALIDSVNAPTTTYSNTGLSEATQYFYRVRAVNVTGHSGYSNEANDTTLVNAPSNLDATTVSNTRIDLTWVDNSTIETGFKIELGTNNAVGPYTQVATVGANVVNYSSTLLTPNTKYYFRVRAYSSTLGNSAYSNVDSATTLPDPPTAPSNLTATAASNTQINLKWKDNSNNETGFKIERKLSSEVTYTEIGTANANDTTYSDNGLTANTAYSYRVRAYNTGGNSSYSNVASATTLPNPPAAPSNLTANAVSNSQINLAWTDASTDELGFIIERGTTTGGPYTKIDTVNANVTNYADTGLTGSTQYFYRVLAYNTGGNSASTEASATTSPDPPAAPSNLTATTVSNNQINLDWTDNANNEVGFKIELQVDSSGTYTEIATVAANTTTYSSTGLDPATLYFYRVRAYNATGNSAYSNEASATTLPDAPTAPSSLTATPVSNTQIDLAWTDNATNETGFKIERKLSSEVTYTQIDTVAANVTSYSNTGLTGNTAYDYRVRAYNAGGHSAYSNVASATTLPNPPAAPSNLTATAVSYSQINLAWTDNANNEDGFKIERKTSGGTYAEIATVGANTTNYSNTGLNGNTQYIYRVRAYNTGGHSAYSDSASATTLTDPPAAPTNLFATTISNSQIDLVWTDNATNETGFIIERKTGTGGTYAPVDTLGANETNYSNTGLVGNTTYYYRVRAYNNAGPSAYSNEASATTIPDPPAAPTNLTYSTVGNTQINLWWTDNSNDEQGFGIERKIGTGGSYAPIDSNAANDTTFSDLGLTPGLTYFYRVFAYNVGGNSGYSNEVSVSIPPTIPAAPSNLTAVAVSNTQIDLAWTDNASNEDGFKIERATASGGPYTQITTVGANVIIYSNTGLSANTQYWYRVRAYNAGGNSSYSNVASDTTLPNPPAAPSNLAATAVSNTQIDLNWTDNANNEDGFKIERKTGASGTFAEIATVGSNVTSYSNTGLTGNTQYFYRVRAYNTGGHSAYTDSTGATTLPDPPAAPNNLAATAVSNSQINLAWTDNASNEDGFKIERKTGASGTYAEVATVGPNVTTYFNTGLATSTEYFYRVRAYNTGGNSAYSNEDSATTFMDPPAVPSNLTATAVSNTQIDLAWVDNANNEDGFIIERKTGAGGTYAQIATVGANVTNYSNTGLTGSTQYYYRVRSFNASWNSPYSNEANATTQPDPVAAPTSLTATAVSSSQINLAWTDNASNEDGFKIERAAALGGPYTQIATVGANVTTYADTGLTASTQYCYRVRAYNAGGNSSYSNEACATTLSNLPAAPSNLTATPITNNQIDLAWTDNSTNETGFKIERKSESEASYTQIDTVAANVTSYQSTGLFGNINYSYRVRAYNANGNSGYSNEANATTLMKGPANLVATPVSSSQINLTWTDQTTNETGYSIERKTGTSGTYAVIGTAGANATTYSDSGLSANTEYCYRVRATSATNVSVYSNEACATTPSNLPAAPSNLTATPVSNTQINLAWTDNANNETGFKIERKTGTAGTYAEIATVGANVTSYSSTGLTANTKYFYRVRAYNANGNSNYSNEANATTLLKAPSNLVATAVSSSQINLSWTDNTTNESGFKIERKTGASGTYAEIATVGSNVTNYSNTGLAAGTEYFYRVRAYTATNVSAYSNEDSATTLSNLPAAPSNLTATPVSNTQIDLTWTDNANNETGFKIERKTGAAGTYAEIATVGQNVTSYSNTGLSGNTKYFYRVRAYNGFGNSNYSNEASATTFLKAPSNLVATAVSSSQINLSWTDNTTNETGFRIERKTGPAGTYVEIATVGANVTNFSNTGLATGTQYFYRVRAYTTTNVSAYSNEASATTLSNLPAAPSNLTATPVSNTQIDLTWTDNANNETGFKIERKTGATGTYAEIATVGQNVTSYSNTGLSGNTKYFYRVRAYNGFGNSDYSNEASATTLLKAPSNLVATAVSSSQINLTWTDNTTNESGFKIERKTGASGTYAEIATVGSNVTNYSNTGLAAGTEYFYRVRAYTATNVSVYSNEANATTLIAKGTGNETLAEGIIPDEIFLAQNYPNPFNPATTISYSLPEGMHVTLKVVNMTGQEVATLVDGYQARGIHRVTFKAKKLPSGVYYAVLKAGEVTQVRRMALTK